jgi:hypothetical protein
MRRVFVLIFLLAFLVGLAGGAMSAQTSSTGGQAGNAESAASSTSAVDYSGMYTFLRDGEFVQITVEDQGKLSGFISRYGDLESDRGAFLDQFIKQGSINGQNLKFATDTVHGVWFEFQGSAGRGAGKTVNDEGYYVLKGTLTQHSSDSNHKDEAKSREVVFKSFPQDVSAPANKPKD